LWLFSRYDALVREMELAFQGAFVRDEPRPEREPVIFSVCQGHETRAEIASGDRSNSDQEDLER
jgi:hypothetical protein